MPKARPDTSQMQLFAKLWSRHHGAVVSYIRVFVRDHALAEDVLQDVAYSAAGSFDRYDASRPFVGWVITIAKQRIIDHYRREDRRALLLSDAAMDSLATASVSAQKNSDSDERIEALRTCLTKLNAKQKKVLESRYAQDHSPKEIADEIGSNAEAVNAMIYRIRKLLLECIKDQMGVRA